MLLVKSAIASTSLYPYVVPPCTELLILWYTNLSWSLKSTEVVQLSRSERDDTLQMQNVYLVMAFLDCTEPSCL